MKLVLSKMMDQYLIPMDKLDMSRGILACVDSDKPLQPLFKLRNSKWCSVSSLTIIKHSSD